jgi:hypothetical protein
MKREAVYTLLFIFAAGFLWQLGGKVARYRREKKELEDALAMYQ